MLSALSALSIVLAATGSPSSAPAATSAPSAPEPAVLMLDAQEPDLEPADSSGSLISRELIRQAILIAGREELGLSTRDATLREPFPQSAAKEYPPIHIKTLTTPKYLQIDLWRDNDPQGRAKYSRRLDVGTDFVFSEAMERLSRGEFVEYIKRAGYPQMPKHHSLAPLLDGYQDMLGEMVFSKQFAVLRYCHETIRTRGESSAIDSALARGYANLGLLASFQWNAFEKVFYARAMLYAARIAAREGATPQSLWLRAYVRILAGTHKRALEDFESAKKKNRDFDASGWTRSSG